MIYKEQNVLLKNGIHATFRTPELDDAETMLDYVIKACGETDFLLRYADEWDKTPKSIESERRWINELRNSRHTLSIACFVDGVAVGHCQLNFESNEKARHRASIQIAIHKAYWGLGIGSYMFREMIRSARSSGVKILELEFIEGNDRARLLYEKFGFTVVAVKPNMFRLRDGSIKKEYYMQKYL
ncbi:MAG: GNAT family N-acetyltransferase [Ruminococcaceae bacterium]|nr:GNAT family N-acetyltransferase [Oscillospiraceae bacterium]